MAILLGYSGVSDMLLQPWSWRMVSSLFPPDVPPLEDAACTARVKACRTHFHLSRQIMLVLAGEEMYCFKNQVYPWRPGMIFYHDSYEPHDDSMALLQKPLGYLLINLLNGRISTALVSHENGRVLTVADPENEYDATALGVTLEQDWVRLKERESVAPLTARMILQSSTALLTAKLLDRHEVARKGHVYTSSSILDEICAHIKETGGKGATLKGMAAIAGYSTYHFARLFRKHTGVSVHEYIDTCRIERSRELFAQGMSRAHVAAALGFADRSSFTRWERSQLTDGCGR